MSRNDVTELQAQRVFLHIDSSYDSNIGFSIDFMYTPVSVSSVETVKGIIIIKKCDMCGRFLSNNYEEMQTEIT